MRNCRIASTRTVTPAVQDEDHGIPVHSTMSLSALKLKVCNAPAVQDEDHGIPVHSTMSLSALKLKIDDQLRYMDGCNIGGVLVPVQLTVQSLNAPETRILHSSDRRKTLDELGIDANSHIIINFQSHSCTWNNRLASTDSSPDQTLTSWFDFSSFLKSLSFVKNSALSDVASSVLYFSNEENERSNEENERILPGAVIAGNSDHVRFLYTLADIGYAYGNNYLRKSASDVLNQIPPDTMSVTMLKGLVESGQLFNLLPSESSNYVLHLLRVLHSLLLPCNGHFMIEATEFQVSSLVF
ncbi:unnamed protein product [Wuchereria bancrofti]|uniref:Uncharacterized protein n=1 Tax=Wuchereria bancrofti TaxID=6293 RepID=A0A3P7DRJ9_WUCBA|nr:unnamed protein product [Wuchereria bancrofti]